MQNSTTTQKTLAFSLLLFSAGILNATQAPISKELPPDGYYYIILNNTKENDKLLAFDKDPKKQQEKQQHTYTHIKGLSQKPKDKYVIFYLEREKDKKSKHLNQYTICANRYNPDNDYKNELYYLLYKEKQLTLSKQEQSRFSFTSMDKTSSKLKDLTPSLYDNQEHTYFVKLMSGDKEIEGNGFMRQDIKNKDFITTIKSPCILSLYYQKRPPQLISLDRRLPTIIDDMFYDEPTNIDYGHYVLILDKNKENTQVLSVLHTSKTFNSIKNREQTTTLRTWTQYGGNQPNGKVKKNEKEKEKVKKTKMYNFTKEYIWFSFVRENPDNYLYKLKAHDKCEHTLTKNNNNNELISHEEYYSDDDEEEGDVNDQLFTIRMVKDKYFNDTGFSTIDCYGNATPIVIYDSKNQPINLKKQFLPQQHSTDNTTSTGTLLSSVSVLLYSLGRKCLQPNYTYDLHNLS